MRYDFIYAALLLGFGTFLLLGAVYTLSRKELVFGIRLIGLIALCGMLQLYGYASLLLTDTTVTMLFVSRLETMGVVFFYIIWFVLAYQQHKRVQKIPFRKVWFLLVLPIIAFLTAALYPWIDAQPGSWITGLYYSGHETVTYPVFGSGFYGITFIKGPLYYVLAAYNSFMLFASSILYFRSFKASKKSVKQKAAILSILSLITIAVPLYGVFTKETAVVDFSAPLVTIVLVYAFAVLYGNEFINLIPSDQAKLFQSSDYPVFVVDNSHLLINVNLKARAIYEGEIDFDDLVLLDDFDRFHPGFTKDLLASGKTEVMKSVNGAKAFYNVRLIDLKQKKNQTIGYLMYFLDITDHKLEIQEMEYIANYDDLTKILNRRAFYLKASEAFSKVSRGEDCFSLIMFDLDGFKEVNDAFGHQSGDSVLNELAKLIVNELQEGDLFGRYGGEEFIIYTKGIAPEQAAVLAESIRLKIEKYPFSYNDNQIRITASFGVSGAVKKPDKTLKQYIAESDKGLYIAKSKGKNKVVVIS